MNSCGNNQYNIYNLNTKCMSFQYTMCIRYSARHLCNTHPLRATLNSVNVIQHEADRCKGKKTNDLVKVINKKTLIRMQLVHLQLVHLRLVMSIK